MTTRIKIAALIQARLSSERCPRKMLRSFGGTTLIDVALDKFASELSVPLYFAVHDEELLDKYVEHRRRTDYGFILIRRNKESAASDDVKVVLNYLKDIEEDYILWINPCHAFLTLDTVEAALKHFHSLLVGAPSPVSMTSVTFTHSWYYRVDGDPINFRDPTQLDTKRSPPLIEVAHAFHIFHRQQFLDRGCFWMNRRFDDPYFYIIPTEEALDIDTELDFEIAEALWRHRKLDHVVGDDHHGV